MYIFYIDGTKHVKFVAKVDIPMARELTWNYGVKDLEWRQRLPAALESLELGEYNYSNNG